MACVFDGSKGPFSRGRESATVDPAGAVLLVVAPFQVWRSQQAALAASRDSTAAAIAYGDTLLTQFAHERARLSDEATRRALNRQARRIATLSSLIAEADTIKRVCESGDYRPIQKSELWFRRTRDYLGREFGEGYVIALESAPPNPQTIEGPMAVGQIWSAVDGKQRFLATLILDVQKALFSSPEGRTCAAQRFGMSALGSLHSPAPTTLALALQRLSRLETPLLAYVECPTEEGFLCPSW